MAALVSLTNYAEGLTPVNAPAGATGYLGSDLFNAQLAYAFRSNAAAATFDFDVDLGSLKNVEAFFFFDAQGGTKGVAQVASVELYFDNAAGFATTVLVGTGVVPNSRGDGAMIGMGLLKRYWRIRLNMIDASDTCRIGLAWLGPQKTMSKQFTRRRVDPQRGTILNETEGGGAFATRNQSYRHKLDLSWSDLRVAQRDALKVIVDSTDGAFRPFVLMPDPKLEMDAVYHGRVDDSWPQETDGRSVRGVRYVFTESGRGL
jgi:hypothetical protein